VPFIGRGGSSPPSDTKIILKVLAGSVSTFRIVVGEVGPKLLPHADRARGHGSWCVHLANACGGLGRI
jgi:hypothetical protein